MQHRLEVYYWNQGGFEVDYLIKKGHPIVAIEVKSGKDNPNKGLALFNDAFQPLSIYFTGTEGIPFEKFSSMNPAELFNEISL